MSTLTWSFLQSQKILNVTDTNVPYPLYVLTGTLLWGAFTDAVNNPLQQVTQAKSLLAKVNFPREALLVAGLGHISLNLAIRFVVLLGAYPLLGVVPPASAVLAPLAIAALLGLGLALGLILLPLGFLYTDVQRALGPVLQLWFFLTPVIYTPPTSGPAALLAAINPVNPALNISRGLLLDGSSPVSWLPFVAVTCVTVLALLGGWLLFRTALPRLVERAQA
jgi:lipopolysaccharide transport system permease protein